MNTGLPWRHARALVQHALRILPNPARGTLHVGHPSGIRSLNWHRPDGSLIRVDAGHSDAERPSKTAVLDLTSLPPGLYLLQIETPDGLFFERVVVE